MEREDLDEPDRILEKKKRQKNEGKLQKIK